MEQDRLRWITRPATLDSWELKVSFASTPAGPIATVWAAGHCDRKRGLLWTYSETIEVTPSTYSLHDLITHLSMVVEQDRPATDAQLTRALTGTAWEEPELPF